jgi:phosphatidylinositol phospholipase C, delta
MVEFNFRVSPFPVVLSIENHCSLEQQQLMAEIMKVAFGDSLLLPGDMLGDTLPSLEQLRGKVLIKGKRVKSAAIDTAPADDDDDDDDEDGDDELKDGELADVKEIKSNVKQFKEKTHQELSAITYLGTCHVKNFSPEESASIPPDMMTSYSEIKTLKYLKKEDVVRGWIEHNKTHLRYAVIL